MRVLLFDDSFTGWSGHNAAYNFAVMRELRHHGIETSVFSNLSAKDLSKQYSFVTPVFSQYGALTLLDHHRRLPKRLSQVIRLLQANVSHFRDLMTLNDQVRDKDTFVVCVYSQATSFAYGLWLRLLKLKKICTKTVFIFHSPPAMTFKVEGVFLRRVPGQCVYFAAHSQRIAELYKSQSNIDISILPFPHLQPAGAPQQADIAKDEKTCISLSFLGLASKVKGFDTLVDSIPLLADELNSGLIDLHIQTRVYPSDPEIEKARVQLIEYSKGISNIHLYPEALSSEQYAVLIQDSDVVVVPNKVETYGYVLSSVFAEALAAGKPVIVAEGTCMAEQLDHFQGGIKFQSSDAASLARAIKQTALHYPALKKQAVLSSEDWLKIHNPQEYVTDILSIIGS